MRFVHTADWHIGSGRDKLPDGEYLNRQMTALYEIARVAQEFADSVVLVSGDIFDRKLVLDPERNAFLNFVDHTTNDGITWLFSNGNHDITEHGLTNLRSLSIMSRNMDKVHVAENHPKVVHIDGVTFVLYPPWEKHCLDSVEAQKDILRYLKKYDLTDAVVSTHFSVKTSRTETGYKLMSGTELRNSKRVAYWALGDVHQMQQVSHNAWYCGNPLNHKWGEQGPKGCLVVDTDNGFTPRFVELTDAPKLVTINSVPAEQPHNSLCRLVAPMRDIPLALPDWIISTEIVPGEVEQVAQEIVEQSIRSDDPLSGIEEVLSGYDLTSRESRWCLREIRRAMRTDV